MRKVSVLCGSLNINNLVYTKGALVLFFNNNFIGVDYLLKFLDSSKPKFRFNNFVFGVVGNFTKLSLWFNKGLVVDGLFLVRFLGELNVFDKNHPDKKITSGNLDYSFFRDDFRRNEKLININPSKIEISIENKKVVLIDDVLFTGRSIRAAMSSIDSYGRPESIELMVLIDRRFKRELPIEANYFGAKIDTIDGDKVNVVWGKNKANNIVYIEK